MKKKYIIATAAGIVAGTCVYLAGKRRNQIKDRCPHNNKRILFLVNHEVVIYNFRLELVERLLHDGYEVHISTPVGERVDKLKDLGAIIHPISFDRHGMNPIDELKTLGEYIRLMKEVQPLIVFGYTIKPNLYGALASRWHGIPFVANITGLGTAVENGGIKQKITVLLYRIAFGTKKGKIQRVFFQNEENEQFFKNAGIALDIHGILPGSGVNLGRFPYREMPGCGDGKTGKPVKFAFISRIMVEKGIEQYLDAAEAIKAEYPNTEFHVCGFFEPEYDSTRLMKLDNQGTIIFHGNIENVGDFMSQMHCIIHPTYYPEGISNVLLEACATGRPIITTNRSGCREVVEDGVNGYMVPCKNSARLIEMVRRFMELSINDRLQMGRNARKKVEVEFDRAIIVDEYINEVINS